MMTIDGWRTRVGAVLAGAALALTTGCATGGSAIHSYATPEEVQVGYGTADRRDVTASVGSVTEEEVQEGRSMSLLDLIDSKVSGVRIVQRPDGDLSLRIRGASSSMDGEPLIVVDGSPVLSNQLIGLLARFSPRDVKRIDVLKDAGSTAMYGVRGGNGVIVITTNRGL